MHLLSLKNAFRAKLPPKLHRQLLHQHHLQCHLHCGNDPTIAKHNRNPSVTHPPVPLAIPFTLQERSYSCKSQWNSVDRTCTKNRWNPIYNAEPIRIWSAHDPTTHETVSYPSYRRGRSSRFGDGLCMELHRHRPQIEKVGTDGSQRGNQRLPWQGTAGSQTLKLTVPNLRTRGYHCKELPVPRS